jgi:hypothetical protein
MSDAMTIEFPQFTFSESEVADVLAIQNVQAAYMQCLGSGEFTRILDLFDLSDPEVTFSFAGRPPGVGPEAVRKEWGMFAEMFEINGRILGAHMLTTPMISFDPDHKTARGSWITWGFTFMGAAFELSTRVAMPTMSTYRNRFRKVDGVWKIYRLDWSIIATMKAQDLNNDWGWVRSPKTSPFPFQLSE